MPRLLRRRQARPRWGSTVADTTGGREAHALERAVYRAGRESGTLRQVDWLVHRPRVVLGKLGPRVDCDHWGPNGKRTVVVRLGGGGDGVMDRRDRHVGGDPNSVGHRSSRGRRDLIGA